MVQHDQVSAANWLLATTMVFSLDIGHICRMMHAFIIIITIISVVMMITKIIVKVIIMSSAG